MKTKYFIGLFLIFLTGCPPREDPDEGNDELAQEPEKSESSTESTSDSK